MTKNEKIKMIELGRLRPFFHQVSLPASTPPLSLKISVTFVVEAKE